MWISVTEDVVSLQNCTPGVRVKRGKIWPFGDQDYYHGKSGFGTIIRCDDDLRAKVEWDNGNNSFYKIGKDDQYHLYLATETRK